MSTNDLRSTQMQIAQMQEEMSHPRLFVPQPRRPSWWRPFARRRHDRFMASMKSWPLIIPILDKPTARA